MQQLIIRQTKVAVILLSLAFCSALVTSWGCAGDGDGNCGSVPSSCSSVATDSCGKCLASCCCSELKTCASDTSCSNLTSCIADCSTDTCSEACISKYSSGASMLSDYLDCTDQHCSSTSKCGE